ncbi:MAG TPA: hypothetical protein PLV39_10175, partial [Fimbriimonadaceae bacterium]|nr:hypothetical protein [Fimbriimonadaceae bacterium]
GGGGGCWGCGPPGYPNDQTWGLLVQPYVKNLHVYRCTMDPNATDAGLTRDSNENPVPINSPYVPYYWTARTNLGYNYDFLAPWLYGTGPLVISSAPITLSQAANTARTFLFADSIWYRNPSNGAPQGGGNWVVEAPCVRNTAGAYLEPLDSIQPPANPRWYNYGQGWAVNSPNSWLVFGGLWGWHGGRANMSFLDGHSTNQTIAQIARGCNVRPGFQGAVFDHDAYQWDLQ